MQLPRKVLNRLRLGRDVAARVAARHEGNKAWVYVYPLLHNLEGVQIIEGGESKAVGMIPDDDAICFLVCRVEFSGKDIKDYESGKIYELEFRHAVGDERWKVCGVQNLEDTLIQWVTDGDQLHEPSLVGYDFDNGFTLMGSYERWK